MLKETLIEKLSAGVPPEKNMLNVEAQKELVNYAMKTSIKYMLVMMGGVLLCVSVFIFVLLTALKS